MKAITRITSLSILFLLTAPTVWAATIQVTTQNDVFMDGSTCSLRDAIESFNNAPVLSGGCTNASADGFGTNDTILLPAGQYNLTLSGPPNDDNSSGDLDIESTVINPLTILGADSANPTATVIDGSLLNPRDRILHVLGEFPIVTYTPVTLDGLTIQNGRAPDLGAFNGDGGGIFVEISGCLSVFNSVVRMNRAGDGASSGGFLAEGGAGGGITVFGSDKPCGPFHIANSVIEDNQAGNGMAHTNSSVGSGGRGGGILSFDTLTMENTTVRNNRAGNGANRVGTGFSGFGGRGGGLYLSTITVAPVTSTISGSTFNDNAAGDAGDSEDLGGWGGEGGGIYFVAAASSTFFTLNNSTLSANAAGNGGDGGTGAGGLGGRGGGLFVESPIMSDDLDAVLNNNTFADNNAGLGGGAGTPPGADGDGGGIFITPLGFGEFAFSIANTILANNTVGATGVDPNCSTPGITDSGFNLETGTDCAFTGTGSKQNANPNLGPLQDNGGPTFTRALLAGSEALDMGNNTAAPGSGFPACEGDDQRGISRPQGSACDIGAYEAQTSDLAVAKLASETQVSAGSTLLFTITVTNNGPDDADFVVVEDLLPTGTTFVSATPDQGTCLESSGTVTCDLGTIPSGAMVEILLEVIPNVDGPQTNTATASFPGIDPDPSNSTASVDYIVVAGTVSGSGCSLAVNSVGAGAISWIGMVLLSACYSLHRRKFWN